MLKLNIPYGQNKLVKIYAISILDASAQTGNLSPTLPTLKLLANTN